MGFDPVDSTSRGATGGTPDGASDVAPPPIDALVSMPDGVSGVACAMRIANTDNAYLPIAQCQSELATAKATCNADAACVLLGAYWYPSSTGVNMTGACADGGGNTGCRQWFCAPRAGLVSPHVPPQTGDGLPI
jgi:hypothetical protein